MGPYPFIHLFYHHSEYLQGTRLHSVHRSESESCLGLERSHFIEDGGGWGGTPSWCCEGGGKAERDCIKEQGK